MNKRILAILLIGSTMLSANAKKKDKDKEKVPQQVVLSSAKDSASYAVGLLMGQDLNKTLTNLPGSYNVDLVIEAITKSMRADTLNMPLKPADAGATYTSYAQRIEKEEADKNLLMGKIFLENNKKNPSVITTNSGLQYEVLREGKPDGLKPRAIDKVKVHYHGTLIDGTVFDSSVDRGTPAEFELGSVIKGWTEGLQLMPIGSKYKFYIPSELAYGNRSAGAKIKPNSVLIFDVELLDVAVAEPKKMSTGKFQFDQYERKYK
ncbi:MAG: FKBP-type peptidyl-prolyl cis-trans isomerase [Paludibacteraceae bacterium]|nr:FKBP-type peptidyl-prolyl cis-trans isomerase [Paludibacteraceae bacterium]